MKDALSKMDAATYAALDPPILPDGTEVIRDAGWYQLVNPALKDASANEVMLSHIKDCDVSRKIEMTFATYRKHGLSFKWAIGPMSAPDLLEKTLASRASASWGFCGMAIDSDAELVGNESIKTELVTESNFQEFLDVNLSGWELGLFAEQMRSKLIKMVKHPHYRCFIARKSGVAIAGAATVLKQSYGYLIGAVVLPQYRGCGAYKALIQTRLFDLRTMNIGFAVTQARSATSAPILDKLGFETVYDAKIYRFDVN